MSATPDPLTLRNDIKTWGHTLGFQQVGVSSIDLANAESFFRDWLRDGFHGEMDYMARHGDKRSRPAELVPGTVSVISVRMDYYPPNTEGAWSVIDNPTLGYISRYALGRDYHKVMRKRLQTLADKIAEHIAPFSYRVFVDSAPVLEKPLAEKAGLGWIGKHTNLLSRQAGSWFFIGEIYTDLALPEDETTGAHCGTCTACIDVCPTKAIIAPYKLDARLCISYLTIELHGAIPIELRRLIGNRIYGCDDCQLICPWNRFARPTDEQDYQVRHGLDAPQLIDLFAWDENTFLRKTEGSAIRRLGHERWLRNIAVALGNAPHSGATVAALRARMDHPSALVREHVLWALAQHDSAAGIAP